MGRAHKVATAWLSALVTVGLAACDFYAGISRYGELSRFPEPDCVEAVVRQTPGVEQVYVRRYEGGRPLTWTGVKPATDVYSYAYVGADFEGQAIVEHRYDGSTSFTHTYGRLNAPVPQERVDAVRPVMVRIERELAARCGFAPSDGELEQTCMGNAECPEATPAP